MNTLTRYTDVSSRVLNDETGNPVPSVKAYFTRMLSRV